MDIMHEFASLRSELEILLSPDLQTQLAEDAAAKAEASANVGYSQDQGLVLPDEARLAELRNKLNL